jgi:hypothetical protein
MITPSKYANLFLKKNWIPRKYMKEISRSAKFKFKKYENAIEK